MILKSPSVTVVNNSICNAWDSTFAYVGQDFFFFQAEDGIRDYKVTGVQTCALPIYGRLLSAGGTLVFAHPGAGFAGRTDTVVFDPATEQWVGRRPMQHGRWYPSLINLGDGRVLVTAGRSETGKRNTSIETFFPASNSWRVSRTPQQFGGLPLYAHLYLLADG